MSRYTVNGETFRRKNLYMPCALGERFDEATPEQRVALFKQTYWADNITNAEWPAVLRHDGVRSYVRSRLKRKAAGWVMALARIAYLNPELAADVLAQARQMYADQVGEQLPWGRLAAGLAGLKLRDDADIELRTVRNDGEGVA